MEAEGQTKEFKPFLKEIKISSQKFNLHTLKAHMLPKAASCVGEYRLPLNMAWLTIFTGFPLPARMWNDHFIGQGM